MNCLVCNTQFTKKSENQKYCSQQCAYNFQKQKYIKKQYDKNGICELCKKEYTKIQLNQKFCSVECRNNFQIEDYNNNKRKYFTSKQSFCELCKKEYTKIQPQQKFCTKECSKSYYKSKLVYTPKGKFSEISDCTVCGKIYTKKVPTQKTCSEKCRKKRTKLLDKGFDFKDNKNFENPDLKIQKRIGGIHPNYCVYCGDFNQCRDHVIPVSYNSTYRDYNSNETVDCCNECNRLAGNYPATSIDDKASYLLQRYKTIYSKILNLPLWENSELDQLKGSLKMQVKANENKRRLILKKMEHLRISTMGILPPNIQNVLKLYRVKNY